MSTLVEALQLLLALPESLLIGLAFIRSLKNRREEGLWWPMGSLGKLNGVVASGIARH